MLGAGELQALLHVLLDGVRLVIEEAIAEDHQQEQQDEDHQADHCHLVFGEALADVLELAALFIHPAARRYAVCHAACTPFRAFARTYWDFSRGSMYT